MVVAVLARAAAGRSIDDAFVDELADQLVRGVFGLTLNLGSIAVRPVLFVLGDVTDLARADRSDFSNYRLGVTMGAWKQTSSPRRSGGAIGSCTA